MERRPGSQPVRAGVGAGTASSCPSARPGRSPDRGVLGADGDRHRPRPGGVGEEVRPGRAVRAGGDVGEQPHGGAVGLSPPGRSPPCRRVTIPWLRSRVAVTWILVLVAAGAIGVSTAAVITVGRARTNWVETSRVTPLTVAETRAVVIVFGLTRSAEARPPASAATWTVGMLPGAKVPAVVWKVTMREPAGSDGEIATVKVVSVAPSAGAWAGAVTKRIVSVRPRRHEGDAQRSEDARRVARAGAETTAEPTCCEPTRSICARPLPSACTLRQPVQPVTGDAAVERAVGGREHHRAVGERRDRPAAAPGGAGGRSRRPAG